MLCTKAQRQKLALDKNSRKLLSELIIPPSISETMYANLSKTSTSNLSSEPIQTRNADKQKVQANLKDKPKLIPPDH